MNTNSTDDIMSKTKAKSIPAVMYGIAVLGGLNMIKHVIQCHHSFNTVSVRCMFMCALPSPPSPLVITFYSPSTKQTKG